MKSREALEEENAELRKMLRSLEAYSSHAVHCRFKGCTCGTVEHRRVLSTAINNWLRRNP